LGEAPSARRTAEGRKSFVLSYQSAGLGAHFVTECVIRILLIEDDAALANRIRRLLTEARFVVDFTADGEKGWALGDSQSFDAAILDLSLPGLHGVEVLKRWRASGRNLPVLILSGVVGWKERVAGLNAGADDYMEKPFQPEELIARLRSIVRRSVGQANPTLSHIDIEFDPACGMVRKAGHDVELTALELRVLGYLMCRPERIVSQNELLDHIYSIDDMRDSNTVEVYISRLRKKLGRDSIRTIRGMGYRMG
jgi:two-component system OmpR family response regulator